MHISHTEKDILHSESDLFVEKQPQASSLIIKYLQPHFLNYDKK